jgi:formylglycine-generating enzyme required for sulfatase activity
MSKSLTAEFESTAGVVMIPVPAGFFMMGSPKSEDGLRAWEQQREVTCASDFYLGKTPVTQDQFAAVTDTTPTVHEKIGDAPVDSVTWDQANEYCQRLTTLDRHRGVLAADWEYRLPTEAEWEYACRAGSSEPRHGEPQDVAWYCENAHGKPHVVGQKTLVWICKEIIARLDEAETSDPTSVGDLASLLLKPGTRRRRQAVSRRRNGARHEAWRRGRPEPTKS